MKLILYNSGPDLASCLQLEGKKQTENNLDIILAITVSLDNPGLQLKQHKQWTKLYNF